MNEYIMSVMLPLLERAWKENPNWRLGQLISNAAGLEKDVFYISDGAIRTGLKGLL